MTQLINRYRSIIAKLLAIWTLTIIVSGVVFMHKEVTSTGQIVTHTHPYDFTNKNKKQHETDNEIQFLNIVFHSAFILSDIVVFEMPIRSEYVVSQYIITQVNSTLAHPHYTYLLRGPPLFA